MPRRRQSAQTTTVTKAQPNILLIMDDQHRFDWLGCAGADWVRTPNIDRLAAQGVRFTHCCTNAPVCVPARIGLACGRQPMHVGALGNDAYLPLSAATYYQHLRDHGYRVGCVGKVDLAKPDKYNGRRGDRPCAFTWGFTHPVEVEGKMHSGNYPDPQGPYGYWLQERGEYQGFHEDYVRRAAAGWSTGDAARDSVLSAEAHVDSYIGTRAVEWIGAHTGEFPWHLFVSFDGPHDPFDPPAEFGASCRNAAVPDAIPPAGAGKPAWIRRRSRSFSAQDIRHSRRQYAACIELIDTQIGRILAAVEDAGQAANTCVIFASDHGEMAGDHGLFAKSVAYEGALRVPLIIAGPGIPPGGVSDTLVELNDVNPTIIDLAGLPPQAGVEAESLKPTLDDVSRPHRDSAVFALRRFTGIRTRRHKLVDNLNDLTELYDLEEDPGEQHNLAEQRPDLCRELQGRLNRRFMEAKWLR
jgi:choline-sulfatase